MPIVDGKYVAPTWINGGPPAIDASELQAISDSIESNFTALDTIPRPNMLKNGYFVGGGSQLGYGVFPLNSRGLTSYSGSGVPTIDKWSADDGMTVSGGYITIPTNSIYQEVDEHTIGPLLGKVVTASALKSDGTLIVGTATVPSSSPASVTVYSFGSSGLGFALYNDGRGQLLRIPAGNYVAAKVELGDTQTLAHQENGVWVLNEIPDFNEELVRCMEGTPTQFEVGSYVGTGTHGSSNPNSLTFDFAPKLFCLYGRQSDSNDWVYPFMDTAYRNVMFNPQTHLSTEFTNYRLPSSANQNATYGKRSADGMTISWYATSADAQNNTTGLIYHYFAIG